MKKIAVTGATGFLGKAVCHRLHRHGYQVLALGRNLQLGQALAEQGIAFMSCDILDDDRLAKAFAGVDAVVHCAALSSAWGSKEAFTRHNVEGTRNVMAAIQSQGVRRFVHISSPSIYFALENKFGIRESDSFPRKQLNLYAQSKLEAEHHVNAFAQESGITTFTLRPQAIFGPGDTAIFPRFLEINRKGGLPVFKDRSPVLDITHVENVAYAIELALTAPASLSGRHYNITNDEPIELVPFLAELFPKMGFELVKREIPFSVAFTLAALLEAFHSRFRPNHEPVLTRYKLGVLSYSRTLDISAAKQELGYRPVVSLARGTDEFVAWWKRAAMAPST